MAVQITSDNFDEYLDQALINKGADAINDDAATGGIEEVTENSISNDFLMLLLDKTTGSEVWKKTKLEELAKKIDALTSLLHNAVMVSSLPMASTETIGRIYLVPAALQTTALWDWSNGVPSVLRSIVISGIDQSGVLPSDNDTYRIGIGPSEAGNTVSCRIMQSSDTFVTISSGVAIEIPVAVAGDVITIAFADNTAVNCSFAGVALSENSFTHTVTAAEAVAGFITLLTTGTVKITSVGAIYMAGNRAQGFDPQHTQCDKYITIADSASGTTIYRWEQIGSAYINMSGYYTKEETNSITVSAIRDKADKDLTATEGNIAVFNEHGNPVDSGIGTDDEPTADSNNLVKSGGLYNRFNNIEEELGLATQRTVTENVEIPMWQSGYVCAQGYDDGGKIYVKGKRYTSSEYNRCTVLIDISKYSKLRYKRIVSPVEVIIAGMCFYTNEDISSVINDAGETFVKGEDYGWQYSEVSVPAGAKYARFSWRLDLDETFECEGIYIEEVYQEGIRQDVSKLKNDVNSLQATTQGLEDKVGEAFKSTIEENVLATWVADGYVCYRNLQGYVEGEIYTSNTSKYSSFIDISKYSTIKYVRMTTTIAEQNILAGLCFYSDANEESVISGSGQGYIHGDAEISFYEDTIAIPAGAKYVRFSCIKEFINDFYCKGIYNDYVYSSGLGKKVEEISDDVETIKETLDQQEIRIDPVLCRRRFYLAMTEWCKNHNLSDSVIIEGAGGGGIGGEVEDEQLGHGLAQYKVGDAAKILFNAYSYDFIANALCEKVHIAYPKGATEGIELTSTSYDYFESDLPDYKPMVWKTGSGTKTAGIMDENYYNLCAICNSEDFNGNLVLGVIRTAGGRGKRYTMFKALMDICKKKINNNDSITTEEQLLISNGQGTNLDGDTVYGNAIAIKVPVGNPKAFHKIDFNDVDSPYIIYAYNTSIPIKTLSMIKLLTAIIVLDYTKDLDIYLTVTAEDRASAGPGSSAYDLLPEGCKITIRDLIYAALLPSSNVACYVLARYVGQFLIETYGSNGFIPATENNVTLNN